MATLAVDSQPNLWAAAPGSGQGALMGRSSASLIGFYGTTPIARPTVTGAKGANAALTSLIAALAAEGLIIDTTS